MSLRSATFATPTCFTAGFSGVQMASRLRRAAPTQVLCIIQVTPYRAGCKISGRWLAATFTTRLIRGTRKGERPRCNGPRRRGPRVGRSDPGRCRGGGEECTCARTDPAARLKFPLRNYARLRPFQHPWRKLRLPIGNSRHRRHGALSGDTRKHRITANSVIE